MQTFCTLVYADIASGVLFFQGTNDSEVNGFNMFYGLEEAQSSEPDTAWGVITRALQGFTAFSFYKRSFI